MKYTDVGSEIQSEAFRHKTQLYSEVEWKNTIAFPIAAWLAL